MATKDPIAAARRYWHKARRQQPMAGDSMALGTVDGRGNPCVRTMLLKGIDARGFGFVTQSHGPKARQMEKKSIVECCANWSQIAMQLRVRGRVIRMPDAEVDALWRHRDHDSKILYHTKIPQSKIIPSYAHLLQQVDIERQQWKGVDPIPRSSWYIGYIIQPQWIEFMHHKASRLNKRERYTRTPHGWTCDCLAP